MEKLLTADFNALSGRDNQDWARFLMSLRLRQPHIIAHLPDMPGKRGADGGLLQPAIIRAPILWLCADQSNGHTSERYIARLWDATLPVDDAAAGTRDQHHEKPGTL